MQRPSSNHGYVVADDAQLPQRASAVKKRSSLRHSRSLERSNGRRSMQAGSVRSLTSHSASDPNPDEKHSAFFCPVPTSGSPTDALVFRFQTWRKILRDLITYYREIESQYEGKLKSLIKLLNVAGNIQAPPSFLKTTGIDDGPQLIRNRLRHAIAEAQRAKDTMQDVVLSLTGLRSDLQQKIKEIKHLSNDFKNTVEREMENTAKSVRALTAVLEKSEAEALMPTGKQDPYLLRLAVDRQIERQIDEENYLHQAYLNLESSGRELEAIIVGETQKAYSAYAGILKRDADHSYNLAEELEEGPVSMPKDREWTHFVATDSRVIDPSVPLRSVNQIRYPGQDHCAALEIRCGFLERKSKYLKSYTAGWYVLSTTHLHEFKSADKAHPPVMSLFLPEQKLGSHSNVGGSSNKFVLKGRQTGPMHRGHTWVFRAESHDSMMAWYEDIKTLTEKSPEERSDFVRAHSRRSLSLDSSRRSASSDGLDEEDEEPFQATENNVPKRPRPQLVSRRSQPGGRFPSDIQVNAQRGLLVPRSPSVGSHHEAKPDSREIALTAAAVVPEATTEADEHGEEDANTGPIDENHLRYGSDGHILMQDVHSQAAIASHQALFDSVNPYTSEPLSQDQVEHHGIVGDDNYYMTSVATSRDKGKHQDQEGTTNGDQQEHQEQSYHSSFEGVMYPVGIDDDVVPRTSLVVDPDAIIESEGQKDDEGLQVVADAGHTPNGHGSSGEYENGRRRLGGDDPNKSCATNSELHIPGEFPGVGVGSL